MGSRNREGFEEALAIFRSESAAFEPLTASDAARRLDCPRETARDRLERLVDRGDVETKPVGDEGRVWWPAGDSSGTEGRNELGSDPDGTFERIAKGFFALDEDWRFTYVNDRAADFLGRDGTELLGATCWEALEPAVDSAFEAELREAMSARRAVDFEAYSPPLDAWFEVDAYPSESGLSVYFRDVTERKERERELATAERRYSTVVDNFPNGAVAMVDRDLRYVTVGGDVITDANASTLEGSDVEAHVSPDLAEVLVPNYRAALDGETKTVETSRDGATYRLRFVPVRDDDGEVFAAIGVSQDITAQVEYEHELEARVGQQEVIAELGRRALENPDLDDLFDEAVERVAETLDNEYCKLLDLDRDAERLHLRSGVGREGVAGDVTVDVDRKSQAGYTLLVDEPVVVEDVAAETRFSGPDLLADHAVESGVSVVVGSPSDPWGILGTHDTERCDFSENDALFVQAVANILATAIDRRDNEHALENQREQLAALNNINGVVRDINEALVEQSTREQIERAVCERLAGSDSYAFAWIAGVDPRTGSLDPHVEAGVDGYLEAADVRLDSENPEGRGPTGRAVRTEETQVTGDALSDPQFEPWRDLAREYGYRSSAAIPVVHGDTLYGVLGAYTERVGAFATEEREVVAQLGEVVGHAIAAVERKQALVSDEIVELELRMENVLDEVDFPGSIDGRVTFDQTVSVGDGTFIQYGTAVDASFEALESLADAVPHWEEIDRVGDGESESDEREPDEQQFELHLSEPPAISVVADNGGYVDAATLEDGSIHVSVHLPTTVDVRRVVDGIKSRYSTAEMVRRRQVRRTDAEKRVDQRLTEELTDRQRAALEASFHAGFFEWPRESSGEDVADSLDVSAPTFHQHLRKAQQKLLESLLT